MKVVHVHTADYIVWSHLQVQTNCGFQHNMVARAISQPADKALVLISAKAAACLKEE